MSLAADHLWNLTLPGRQVDPAGLAAALEAVPEGENLDFRTRLLIRDSLVALQRKWGEDRFIQWLAASSHHDLLERILRSDLGPPGFPSLEKRVMEPTRPQIVLQMLRELGSHVRQPTRMEIGGSIALILASMLSRTTEDIDVVNEVPLELRSQHALLDEMLARYDLRLTHFQSHFLPSGWESRLRSLGRFGQLDVFVVDPLDILVSKLLSVRVKDLDDLRMLVPQVDKASISDRLRDFAKAMLVEPDLAENAKRNWYVLFGETLPV